MVDEWPKDWPPAILWDTIYGVFFVKNYGNPKVVDIANAAPKTKLYPEGIQTATERAKNGLERKKPESKQRKEEQARIDRAARRGGVQDKLSLSDALDVVLYLRMDYFREAQSKATAVRTRREKEELHMASDKVDKWRSEVADLADSMLYGSWYFPFYPPIDVMPHYHTVRGGIEKGG